MTLFRRGRSQALCGNLEPTNHSTDHMCSDRIVTVGTFSGENPSSQLISPASSVTSSPISSRSSSLSPTRSSSRITLTSFSDGSGPSPPIIDDKLEDSNQGYSPNHHRRSAVFALEPAEALTLSFHEARALMPWQMDNENIRRGYRRPTPSFKGCVWSIVGYLHNETVNILSHLIGAVTFLLLLPLHLMSTLVPASPLPFVHSSHHHLVPHTLHDKIALTVYLLAAFACLGLSATFHTVSCHSKDVSNAAHRGDYIGIIVLVVGSTCPGIYYAFHGQLFWQLTYIAFIAAIGLAAGSVILSPHYRSNRWHRTLTFIGLGASACFPYAHVLITQGLAHARSVMSIDLIIMGGLIYVIGALVYATRIPEVLSPGTFDYFGSSHQIFHILVNCGTVCQYLALRGMIFGRAAAVGQAMAEEDAAAAAVADDRWSLIASIALKKFVERGLA
ncbi:integral membrane protein [Kwoniella heveanensis BCC8398]|uniref:Integral membrane protein n=1 Tax=Kwoniella heveanensis BCC8398 TaxID=1296120 RepID=A0A1B9GZ90_9TREE|nr:integral membrane protein [Kwoniella heveanensis BCC8398]